MSLDWYPGMRECCSFWGEAAMLQQTFEALEKAFQEENDACIDCAKCMVEVVCRIIIDELDDPAQPLKPLEETPTFGKWVSAAVRALKLGDNRDAAFQKLISQHHKLTETLGTLRNGAGPVSHGREGFIEKLSNYHRRAAVLSADAIVSFLHHAYLEAEVKLVRTKLPYDRFAQHHGVIDEYSNMRLSSDEDRQFTLTVTVGDDEFPISLSPSQLLFQFDRTAYVEALKLCNDLQASALDGLEPIRGHEVRDIAEEEVGQ